MRKLMLSLLVIAILGSAAVWADKPIFSRSAQLPSISNFSPVEPVAGPVNEPAAFNEGAESLPQIGPGINSVSIPGVFSSGSVEVFGSGAVEVFGSGSGESPFAGHAMYPLNPPTTGSSSLDDFLNSVTNPDSFHGNVCPWK